MYILQCADGSYYTGSTFNLEKRLWEHNNGLGSKHTRKRLPVELVYCEEYGRVEDAFQREKQIQGWSRRKKEALIAGNFDNLIAYARNYTQFGDPASTSSASELTLPQLAKSPLPELAEGNLHTHDPASTGSASELTLPQLAESPLPELVESPLPELVESPLPELVEGNLHTHDPASTSSASELTLPQLAGSPLPELVEGNLHTHDPASTSSASEYSVSNGLSYEHLEKTIMLFNQIHARVNDETFMAEQDKITHLALQAGLIWYFTSTYELCWKAMKRWLTNNISPDIADGVTRRELFRLAAENLLIEDVDEWMVYHAARNQTSNHEGLEIADDVAHALEAFSRAARRLLQTL